MSYGYVIFRFTNHGDLHHVLLDESWTLNDAMRFGSLDPRFLAVVGGTFQVTVWMRLPDLSPALSTR